MTLFICLLVAAVLAKAVLVTLTALLLRPFCRGPTEAILAGWLCAQAGLTAGLIVLSSVHAVTLTAGWIGMALAIGGLTAAVRRRRPMAWGDAARWLQNLPAKPTLADAGTAASIAAIFLALAIHAVYFYDTTGDAIFYGMSRIAYWHQQRSLLTSGQAGVINLFVYAWNGELNAFFYFLLTGQDRACSFGNVEVLAMLLPAVVFWFRGIGHGNAYAWAAAFLIVCMPVNLYLAMTVKGDLHVALGGMLGVAWTILAFRPGGRPSDSLWAIVALSYAGGSKISGIFIAAPLILVHSWLLFRVHARWTKLWAAAALAAVNLAWYLLNLSRFGAAAGSDQPLQFTVDHIVTNVRGLFSSLFVRGLEPNQYYAIFGGFGLVAIIASALVIALGLPRVMAPVTGIYRRGALVPLAIFFASYLVFIACLPWFPWSVRYMLPWALPFLLLPFLALGGPERPRDSLTRNTVTIGLLLFGWLHAYGVYRPSEVTPGSSLADAFGKAFAADDLGRKLAGHDDLLATYRRQLALAGDAAKPLNVRLLSPAYAFLFPLWGDNAKNNVGFVETPGALHDAMTRGDVDLAVIVPPSLMPDIRNENYVCEDAQQMKFCRRETRKK